MKDDTVELLAALDPTPLGDAFAEQRKWTETHGEQIATAAAPIRTTRALLLLLDVLVGITTGRLRHDQSWWHTVVTEHEGEPATRRSFLGDGPSACGTYRCLAGWLVTLRWPTVKPIEFEKLATNVRTYIRYEGVWIDGEARSYYEMGARALDVVTTVLEHGPGPGCGDDDECSICSVGSRAVAHDVGALFSGSADLPALWDKAREFTGGVITVPTDLVPLVDAARVVAW